MKRILLAFLLFFVFIMPKFAYSCALPPDILHEWSMDMSQETVIFRYSLLAWDNLVPDIMRILEQQSGLPVTEENLDAMVQKTILPSTNLQYDTIPVGLQYQSGSLVYAAESLEDPGYNLLPEPIFIVEFHTDIPTDFSRQHEVFLEVDTSTFASLSPLIHPYLTTEIQKQSLPLDTIEDSDGRIVDVFAA